MKKLIALVAVAVMASITHAASFNWQAANIYSSDMVNKYSGTATIFCSQVTDWSATATVTAGAVAKSTSGFSSEKFVAGEAYDFYFTIEDKGKTFTSSVKSGVIAQQSDTATVNFANMQSATQTAGNWKASEPTPEPTSGMLLLLGLAGLALKRKQA